MGTGAPPSLTPPLVGAQHTPVSRESVGRANWIGSRVEPRSSSFRIFWADGSPPFSCGFSAHPVIKTSL